MIVPDRELGRSDEQALQRRKRTLPAIAGRHRCPVELVGRLEVEVVAEPDHQVGGFRRDGVEDPVAAAVGARVPRRLRRGEEEAGAERDRDVGRLLAAAPIRLRADDAFAPLAVAVDRVRRALARREPGQPGEHDVVVAGARLERRFVIEPVVRGAPADPYRAGRLRLHPQQCARVVGVAVHDDEPGLRGRRDEQDGGNDASGEAGTHERLGRSPRCAGALSRIRRGNAGARGARLCRYPPQITMTAWASR